MGGLMINNCIEALIGHDVVNLRRKVRFLKQTDGEGWAVGELLERVLNLYALEGESVFLPKSQSVFLPKPQEDFFRELTSLINRYSLENASHTPDFILAEYMGACLAAFNRASNERERWYGRGLRIGGVTEDTSGPYDSSNVTEIWEKLRVKCDHKTPPEPKTVFAEKTE